MEGPLYKIWQYQQINRLQPYVLRTPERPVGFFPCFLSLCLDFKNILLVNHGQTCFELYVLILQVNQPSNV